MTSIHRLKTIKTFVAILSLLLAFNSCASLSNKVSKKKILDSEMGIIVSYLNSGETKLALKRLNNLKTKYPNNSDFMNLMGITQMALNNSSEAIRYFNIAFKHDPKSHTLLNLGSALISLKKYKKARSTLAKALKLDPDYKNKERIYHNIAYSYQKQKQYKLAVKYYKKALLKNPTYHKSWQELANAYEVLKISKKALHAYTKSVDFCQNCYSPNLSLAKAHIRRNNNKKAIIVMKKFLEFDNINPTQANSARKTLAQIKRKSLKL